MFSSVLHNFNGVILPMEYTTPYTIFIADFNFRNSSLIIIAKFISFCIITIGHNHSYKFSFASKIAAASIIFVATSREIYTHTKSCYCHSKKSKKFHNINKFLFARQPRMCDYKIKKCGAVRFFDLRL